MDSFMAIALIALMVEIPAVIFFRVVKYEGVSMRALASGWPLVGAIGILVWGSLGGAECMLLFQVVVGFFLEFTKQPQDARFFIAPTLLNLVALLVFIRMTCEQIDSSTRLVKRGPMKADKTT